MAFRIGALLICMALLVAGPPPHSRAAPSDSAFGVNSHLATRHPNTSQLQRPTELLGQLGVGWVREDIHWFSLEPQPGQYNWGPLDQAIDQLAGRGLNIIGLIGHPPGWATPFGGDGSGEPSFYPPDPQRYAGFASAVVARYKGKIRHWELWNEPENDLYWRPQPDPAVYAALLKAAYPAIKAADPGATVLSGGIVPTHIDFLRALADHGAWGAFDIVAIHPYVDPYGPEAGQIGTGDVSAIKALVASLGNKPIWATEYGWSAGPAGRDPAGVDEETQANYIVRGAALLRAAGVERVLLYNLKDTELRDGRTFNHYGLLRYSGGLADYDSIRPSFAAFRTLNQQLAGTSVVGTQDLGSRQVVLDFESFGSWRRGTQPNGTLTQSTAQRHGGSASAALAYSFPGAGNDYVVFTPDQEIAVPSASQLGMWVRGDGSGHALKVWLRDSQGETLQFRLGFVGGGDWQFLAAPINGPVEDYNRISGGGNLRLDFPARLAALVLDDEPDSRSGQGTIYLDDMTAVSGPEAYGVRFSRAGQTVDMLWSPQGGTVGVPAASAQGRLVGRDGGETAVSASGGQFSLNLGPSPVYLIHAAGAAQPPPANPTPPAGPNPTPAPAGPAPAPSDGSFADPAFRSVWERTDLPVASGAPRLQPRSWLWGPQPLTAGAREAYAEGPGGTRQVQYFDKSRMEINSPDAPRNQWYVTNGLLVVEMIDGRVQVGNSAAEPRAPADEAVAGDPAEANPSAPTYRSFRSVAYPTAPGRAAPRQGATVTAVLNRDGSVGENPALASYGVRLQSYDEQLGHNIPEVFVTFFTQRGLVYENGGYTQGPLMDWLFVMGLPISEPYWARVRVGGVEKDVLMQAFERRVLTYTPSNAPEWRVEMGNVGQHYLRWRYGR